MKTYHRTYYFLVFDQHMVKGGATLRTLDFESDVLDMGEQGSKNAAVMRFARTWPEVEPAQMMMVATKEWSELNDKP